MLHYTIFVETEEKRGTHTQSVSQRSADISTSALAKSTSSSTYKGTQSKGVGSSEATVMTLIETDNLKRLLTEEDNKVKPKKRKEDHNPRSKGKNEAFSSKPQSDDDKSVGCVSSNTESLGNVPNVSPLKMMVPTTDADTVITTYDKNGNRSHHTVLLYEVLCEEAPSSSSQPYMSKSVQKVNTIAVDAQKLTQTRVLRSSNRCSSNSSSATRQGTSPIVLNQTLAQITSLAAVAGSSNMSPPTTRSEQIENVSATVLGGDDKPVTTTDAATTTAATTTITFDSSLAAELSAIELHLGQGILKASCIESETSDTSSVPDVIVVETNPFGTTRKPTTVTNGYEMFLNMRKQIDKRRKNVFPVQPKPPSGFNNYLMNKKTYLLAENSNNRVVNSQTPSPANLNEQMKNLFVEQDGERQRLRVQHIVEKEKLVLSVEQEILRVHGRAARALANQPLPFSVCTILKDEEVYNIMTPEQEEKKDKRTRRPFDHDDGRLFLSWLQEVDDKWEKIKESMLLRHHNEAESLHAVQKMDWGWKLKELQLCTYSSEPNIDEENVPMVPVSDDFNLLPA